MVHCVCVCVCVQIAAYAACLQANHSAVEKDICLKVWTPLKICVESAMRTARKP
jgi:hypothetical protein